MRLLAHGASLRRPGARMAAALAGLAMRGHEVYWMGGAAPGESALRAIAGPRALMGLRADVVVGGDRMPQRTAACGWLAGAHVMVLDLTATGVDRWGLVQRWAWQSLYSVGLVEEKEATLFAAAPSGLARERIGLWPSAEAPAVPDPGHPDAEVLERACERALARHRGRAPRPAVFLDRDGTLIRPVPYLSEPEAVELLPGVARALRNVSESGVPLVVVSNQSGVGRGLFTVSHVHAVMARLRERLREHGVELTSIRFCPHLPEDDCACRKPRSGMLELAAEDLEISLRDSVMIGDQLLDAAAGQAAGGMGILVRTGGGAEAERGIGADGKRPDRVCDDLPAAIDWWLGEE
jgi:D-glycero-D-manno-heptose 1,7-bisphosphate phosphatase